MTIPDYDFKSLYPKARIVAVEPDPKMFGLLEWNIKHRGYSDVKLVNRAVSVGSASVSFYREGADSGRTFPIEGYKEVVAIGAVHLDDLITEPVDFLKMDIEGDEGAVICSSAKLHAVSQLFFEYHSFRKTDQALGAILQKLSDSGFRYYIHKQFCSSRPLTEDKERQGMDMQLNVFAKRTGVKELQRPG